MFKVGQKVYDFIIQKWGKVGSIDNEQVTYPVEVNFENGDTRWYTSDGRYMYEDKLRSLYWDIPTVTGGDKPPFESKLVGKTVVMYHGHNHGPVIGKVTAETENLLTIAGRPGSLHKSGIITMYELGDQIQDW